MGAPNKDLWTPARTNSVIKGMLSYLGPKGKPQSAALA